MNRRDDNQQPEASAIPAENKPEYNAFVERYKAITLKNRFKKVRNLLDQLTNSKKNSNKDQPDP